MSELAPAHDGPAITRFEALFQANLNDLNRFAARRVQLSDVDDIVAEVFLIAWRRNGDYREEHARLWLFGVAEKVIANHVRSARRRQTLQQHSFELSSSEIQPDLADATIGLIHVREVLTGLPERDQEILRLMEWDGFSVSEAARIFGASPATFRVQLHRARRRFAAALSGAVGSGASPSDNTSPSEHKKGSP